MSQQCNQFIEHPKQTFTILLQGMDEDTFEKKFNTLEVDFIRSQQLFCRDVLKLSPGQRAVISNGRVSGLNTVQLASSQLLQSTDPLISA